MYFFYAFTFVKMNLFINFYYFNELFSISKNYFNCLFYPKNETTSEYQIELKEEKKNFQRTKDENRTHSKQHNEMIIEQIL